MPQGHDARTLLRLAVKTLADAGIESAVVDARLLFQFVAQVSREDLVRDPELELPLASVVVFNTLIDRRARHEPVSHLLGEREFWGLPFSVSSAVLDPRPDSETLVEAVLSKLDDRNKPMRILDLGTGSGCLLLALLHELPNAWGVGIDLSGDAIEIAKTNAVALKLSPRATFCRANWFAPIAGRFDFVVSNPPYIVDHEIDMLEPEVASHEPRLALAGGPDGLAVYRHIMSGISGLLIDRGWLALECGIGQFDNVTSLCSQADLTTDAAIRDLNGVARVLMAQFKEFC